MTDAREVTAAVRIAGKMLPKLGSGDAERFQASQRGSLHYPTAYASCRGFLLDATWLTSRCILPGPLPVVVVRGSQPCSSDRVCSVVTPTAQRLEQLAPSGFLRIIAVDVGYAATEQQLCRFKVGEEEGVTNSPD